MLGNNGRVAVDEHPGPAEDPGQLSIGSALRWHAGRNPGAIAVRDDVGSLTRAELDDASDAAARTLRGMGVLRGDLVTIALENSLDFVIATVALWKLGATPHPVSPRAPATERDAIIAAAQPRLVIGAAVAQSSGHRVFDEISPSWKASSTGGSTGRPKVVISGSAGTIDPTVPTAPFLPRDAVQLVAGPLHHSAPFTYAMRGLMLGHELVLLPRSEAGRVLAAIGEHGITWMMLVPTMMLRIWRHPARRATVVSRLERIVHIGAPCPAWLKRSWLEWLGPERVTEVYAGTESVGLTVIEGHDWLAHPGSVGRAADGFAFRILDAGGERVPPGTLGRVFSMPPRGTGSTYHYRGGTPDRVDGWDTLGDLGWLDVDGYLYLADRAGDVIATDGGNVYPAEVEASLEEHPAVRSSAVLGLPDDLAGDRVHALVELDPDGPGATVEELSAFVAERLPRRKVPSTLELVDGPLRDDAGKLRRSALREDRLGS